MGLEADPKIYPLLQAAHGRVPARPIVRIRRQRGGPRVPADFKHLKRLFVHAGRAGNPAEPAADGARASRHVRNPHGVPLLHHGAGAHYGRED